MSRPVAQGLKRGTQLTDHLFARSHEPARSAEPDLKVRLHEAIDALPDRYRMVVVMHDVEGYTHEEIAETLGVEVGTSKAQLSRARAKLRETLADFAGEWAS